MRLAFTALLFAALAVAQPRYRMNVGEGVILNTTGETAELLRTARSRSATLSGTSHLLTLREAEPGQWILAAPLTTPPGDYSVEVALTAADGSLTRTALSVTLDPLRPVPNNATRPPVILLNGYQLASLDAIGKCRPATGTPRSSDTFGDLEASLTAAGAPAVYFFDNCVQSPGDVLENLGGALGQFIDLIKYENGQPVPQVDLVAHSMGALIARSYLAGLRADGTLNPPANPRVRKFVEIAAPNFGSFLAGTLARNPLFTNLLDPQGRQLIPGSPFLWRLGTWNQFGDDLRGVDALSLLGSLGRTPFVAASDGVVSLSSGSLGFAQPNRTRILPFCHIESNLIECPGLGIAKAADTATLVNSFLQNTSTWQTSTISRPAATDPYLSTTGGLHVTAQNPSGQDLTDTAAITFGNAQLAEGGAAKTTYWTELNQGTNPLRAASASLGLLECGTLTQPIGYVYATRCKPGLKISSVSPLVSNTAARLVNTGAPITISGSGFGATRCATCTVIALANAPFGALPAMTSLTITRWTDTAITADLPASITGYNRIQVQGANASDQIGIMAANVPLRITEVVNGASFQPGFAPNSWVTIKGDKLARSTREWATSDFINGALPTTLDGVRVIINGQPAAIAYISPTQLNVLAPSNDNDATAINATIEVNSPDGNVRGTANRTRYAPAIFTVAGYAAVLNTDRSIPAPANAIPGVFTHPARPGDTLVLYATGFGTGLTQSNTLTDPVTITIANTTVTPVYAGLTAPGLYQFNFVVPSLPAGNHPISLSIAGLATQNTPLLSLAP